MADPYISESEEEQGTMTHSNTELTGLRKLSSSNLTILDKSVFTDSASFIVANPDVVDCQPITPSLIHSMIGSTKVSVLPALLCLAGCSDSGQDVALKQFLNLHHEKVDPSEFSSHHILATDLSQQPRFLYVNSAPDIYMFGFQSLFRSNAYMPLYETGDQYPNVFKEHLLNDHMQQLLEHLKSHNEKNKYLEEWMQKAIISIAKGAGGLLKIWNVPREGNVLHFLRAFTGRLHKNHMWLFAKLEHTLKQFKDWEPPSAKVESEDDEKVKPWYSDLDYLVRSSKVCLNFNKERKAVCQVFTSSIEKNRTLLEENIEDFEKEIKFATSKLKINHLVKEKVIHFDTTKNQYRKFDDAMRDIVAANSEKIYLSWLFLRGSLERSPEVFMRKKELQSLAFSCEIESESFEEFCKFFTSFGSIFDISLVSNSSDVVVIKPDKFLSDLHNAFTGNPNQSVSCNGIITRELAKELFGKEGLIFMETLSEVDLVCRIPKGQYGDGSHDECFFMPCARMKKQCHSRKREAVCLFITNLSPPTFTIFEVAFAKRLLKKLPNARLQPSEYENETVIIIYDSGTIKISGTYKGNCIEIVVSEETTAQYDTHRIVVEVVKEIAREKSNKLGQMTYQFAVICTNEKEHHMLPDDKVCIKCSKNRTKKMCLEKWSAAIEKVPYDEYRLASDITSNDVSVISEEISSLDDAVIKSFVECLKVDYMADQYHNMKWCVVMNAITQWMKNEKAPSKALIAKKLLHIAVDADSEDASFKLKTLARRIYTEALCYENELTRGSSFRK